MTGQSLEHALSDPAIPAIPATVAAAISTADGDADPTGLIERCGLDPAMALAALGRVNADRGPAERIGCIRRAIGELGIGGLRKLALSLPVGVSTTADPAAIDFDFGSFHVRAIRSSVAARQVALVAATHAADEAAVAALLQDVGMVALHRAFGDRYLQVLDIAGREHGNLGEVEQRTLRIDHAMVGAELATRARLPESIVSAIRNHHQHASADRQHRRLAAIVELSSIAALALDDASIHSEDATVRFRRSAHAWLGIAPHEALVLLEEVRAESSHRLAKAGVGTNHDAEELSRRIHEARRAVGLAGPPSPAAGCTRDPLTGLPDRESFIERLDASLGFERPCGGSVAILVASVDDLRNLNLRLGVRGGDALLRAVAMRLAAAIPPGTEAFRLMGGQFAILGPGLSPLDARRLADDLRRAATVDQIEVAGERSVRVTLSVGAAIDRFAPEHPGASVATARENLVRSALSALAAAESDGRNRTELFRDGRDAA